MSDETDARIERMEKMLEEMRGQLTAIGETLVKADTTITTVADQVKPTLDSLMESPMLRMLTGGKKKS